MVLEAERVQRKSLSGLLGAFITCFSAQHVTLSFCSDTKFLVVNRLFSLEFTFLALLCLLIAFSP